MLMAVSLLSSLFISYLYVHFYSNRATGSQVHRAFPLLGISITAIFVTIQFSLPLSLGLARRAVDSPLPDADQGTGGDRLHHARDRRVDRDGNIQAGVRRDHLRRRARGAVRPGAHAPFMGAETRRHDRDFASCRRQAGRSHRRLPHCFASGCRKAKLESVSQTDRETVVSYNFQGIADGALTGLQAELDAAAGPSTYNVFFNRPGAL